MSNPDYRGPLAPWFYPGAVPPPQTSSMRRSILDWDAEQDPDLPLLRSTVPLAARPPRLGPKVMALAAFGPTSRRSVQGGTGERYYAFSHWDLLDLLVTWGGSSAEGLIVVPEAPVVDAGHRAGVPVLGTVFLPQREHGGRPEWTLDLLARDDTGRFLLIPRLAQAAAVLGFDGWFINAETQLEPDNCSTDWTAQVSTDMLAFVRELSGAVDHVVWYDSMTHGGSIDWQDGVTEHNRGFVEMAAGGGASEIFLNFNWARRPGRLAQTFSEMQALRRDVTDLYFGVDTEAAGVGTQVQWPALVGPDGLAQGSIGIYRPEGSMRHLQPWTLEDFDAAEQQFWRSGTDTWPGIATVVNEVAMPALPWLTTFNVGAGRDYFVDGEPAGLGPWHHLGVQDPMPPRWCGAGADLQPRLVADAAWQGGQSLIVTASAEPGSILMWRGVATGGSLQVTVVAQVPEQVTLSVLADSEGSEQQVALADAGPAAPGSAWHRWTATVVDPSAISLHLVGATEAAARIGSVSVTLPGASLTQVPVPVVAHQRPDGVLLTWDRDAGAHHYLVFAGANLIGLASGAAYLVCDAREGADYRVVAVMMPVATIPA